MPRNFMIPSAGSNPLAVQAQQVAPVQRQPRRPRHSFQLIQKPWDIQPFMIAPVLPGETMKNLLVQARCVTDPVLNKLVGWWNEYYFFYVKVNDLDGRDDFRDAFVNPAADLSAYHSAEDAYTYHYGNGSINWTELCLRRVVDTYFRNEGETYATSTNAVTGLPRAGLGFMNWTDSLLLASELASPDFDADANADDTYTASEIATALQQWAILQQTGLTDMSYEDYLATYGVTPPKEQLHIPEVIRYVREWSYPTNTVEPTTGVPSSAVAWSTAERADKDRRFREPGFLIGLSVVRPKVYMGTVSGSMSHALETIYDWLPAVLTNDPQTSRKLFAAESVQGAFDAEGPIQDSDADYIVDMRDLFMHGDQFLNFRPYSDATERTVDAGHSAVAIPLDTLSLKANYLPDGATGDAMVDALFADQDPGDLQWVRQDGIVNLTILGNQMDTTAHTT